MNLQHHRVLKVFALVLLLFVLFRVEAADSKPPLKVLLIVSGGYHDYKTLVPFISSNLTQQVNATIDQKWGLETLKQPNFADGYDAVIYDVCDDEVPDESIENALRITREGKPTVMIHCAVHAFRKSAKVSEWEMCCGMRSKVHDPYGPFTVVKVDQKSPITKFFPQEWNTAGDELYQTMSIHPKSRQLLKVKSPHDGRESIVCWSYQYGRGPVFATTLGHDMKTTSTPEYMRLVANGLLWTCGKLQQDGTPASGYGATENSSR